MPILTIQAEGGPLALSDAGPVRLTEAVNQHPTLEADLTPRGGRQAVLSALGRDLVWQTEGGQVLFTGVVAEINWRGSGTTIIARGKPSFGLDLVRRVRSFATPDGKPVPVHLLPGLAAACPGVAGFQLLGGLATGLTQFEETDWDLLLRLATSHGLAVVAGTSGIRLVDAASDPIQLRTQDVFHGEGSETVALCVGKAESISWNDRFGTVPAGPVSAEPEAGPAQPSLDAAGRWPADPSLVHRIAPVGLAGSQPDADLARDAATRELARALTWEGDLSRLDIGVGSGIILPQGQGPAGTLAVVARCLNYRPHQRGHQLVNRVTAQAVLSSAEGSKPVEPRIIVGEVLAVGDNERLGMVRVRLPWQPATEGLWCRAPQTSGGIEHGTFLHPAVKDWAAVLFEPRSFRPPTVLGAFYTLSGPLPSLIAAPSSQHLLLQTSTGQSILVDEAAGEVRLTIAEGEDERCSVRLSRAEPRVHVLATGGSVSIEGQEITITAAGTLELKGQKVVVRTESKVEIQG